MKKILDRIKNDDSQVQDTPNEWRRNGEGEKTNIEKIERWNLKETAPLPLPYPS
jgi:hypothetical protein